MGSEDYVGKRSICKNCKSWAKGECYANRDDWGNCVDKEVTKQVAPANRRLGTFEGFGCRHFKKKVYVRM